MRFKNHPFRSEAEAAEFLDAMRWPDGVSCPGCGNHRRVIYDISRNRGSRSAKHPEGKIRYGLRKCSACRLEFRATHGTPFHGLKVPLDVLLASIVLCRDRYNDLFNLDTITAFSQKIGVKRDTANRLIDAAWTNMQLRRIRQNADPSATISDLTLESLPTELDVEELIARPV